MRTIVLGYDGSEQAERALARCADLARPNGGRIVVVTVDTLRRYEAREVGASEEHLATEAAARLRADGLDASARLGVGEPGRAIADIAREEGAELVVVGARHLTWLDRLIEGSTSDAVAHRAAADVLIVH